MNAKPGVKPTMSTVYSLAVCNAMTSSADIPVASHKAPRSRLPHIITVVRRRIELQHD
jgi:hypothetical protein